MGDHADIACHHYNPVDVEFHNTVGAIFLGLVSLLLLFLLARQQKEIERLNRRLSQLEIIRPAGRS
jgi:hypothetical protein